MGLSITIFSLKGEKARTYTNSVDEAFLNISLMAVFFCVLYQLIRLLNTLSTRGNSFHQQKKSVLLQFIFFEIAFATQVIFQVVIDFSLNNIISDYYYAIAQAAVHLIHNFMPMMFMLYCHHLTFKAEIV